MGRMAGGRSGRQVGWHDGVMSDDVVLLEVSERIATITLNRPAARNAMSSEVLRLLPKLMKEADGRDDVDVIILTGADPAFCAGLDLKELGNTATNLERVRRRRRSEP